MKRPIIIGIYPSSDPGFTAFRMLTIEEIACASGFSIRTESPPCRDFASATERAPWSAFAAKPVPVLEVTFTDKKKRADK